MDASLAAVVFGTVNLALLGLLFLAWRRDRDSPSWRLKTALRLQEHDQRLNGLNGLLKEQDELRRVVRGELLACLDGQAKELGALKEAVEDGQTGARLAELASCVEAHAVEIDALKGGCETFEGGMSLETASLRKELEALRGALTAQAKNAGAEARLVGLTLADRIGALNVRMDALELACGKKEGVETVKGAQSRSGWKTALQSWKALLGTLKGIFMPLWRVLQRGKQ